LQPGDSTSSIAVIGCGHVGAITAAGLARLGHDVRGIDVNVQLVERLNAGSTHLWEPGFEELLQAELAAERLCFTTSFEQGLRGAQFIFLCVDTPATPAGAPNMRHLREAVARIGLTRVGQRDRVMLINKSTSPVGTGDEIEAMLARALAVEARPAITTNPEFLREGTAVHDFFNPSRIVIGARHKADGLRLSQLYCDIDAPRLFTDIRSAEMIKYVANAFLATRLSFINEIAGICDALDVDIDDVVRGIGLDPRIGSSYLTPGIGYGGSCLPKDVAALRHTSEIAGVAKRILDAVHETNLDQVEHAVAVLRGLLGPLAGRTIAVWGAAFKGGTEDLRDSPALQVIERLRGEGALVRLFDPALYPDASIGGPGEICCSALEAVDGADALSVLTDWPEFLEADFAAVRSRMSGTFVFDGRNFLPRDAITAAGLRYYSIGRARSIGTPPQPMEALSPSPRTDLRRSAL
jgi:UDPglucose 6-dehydrogenase